MSFAQGARIGALGVGAFLPLDEVREALGGRTGRRDREGVRRRRRWDRRPECASPLSGLPPRVHDVVAGLGGRPITRRSLLGLFDDVLADRLEPRQLHFLDLNRELVERELERMQKGRRPGPHAENILRDLGVVAAGSQGDGCPSSR